MTDEEALALRRGAETPVEVGPEAIEAVAADLAAAFADYPMFDWILRDDARRPDARLRFFRMMLSEVGLPTGTVWRPGAGGAASVWIPSEKLGPNPLWQEIKVLPVLLEATGWRRFPRLAKLRKAMDRYHPLDRPHAYLWLLGVHPDAQGLGIGSRLLSAGLRDVDNAGLPAFLETSTESNVALYRRHGFETINHYFIEPGSPPSWGMWREARTG